MEHSKKSVADIIIERFLKDVDEKGTMPWQRPYERYNAFNYFTCKTYRGINRLLLPFGEYLTKKQINEYNKQHNEDFRFQKGIEWFPVVFFTVQERAVSRDEILDYFTEVDFSKNYYVGTEGVWNYYVIDGKAIKKRNVLRYFEVAERKHFKNSKGEMLPSKIENKIVVVDKEEPRKVIENYLNRNPNLTVSYDNGDTPCYIPMYDRVELNPYVKSEDSWFSIAFHELAHSTGHYTRLNREGIHYPKDATKKRKEELYAIEECIAEITACLLCAECGIHDMVTSGSMEYNNSIAYVQTWKKRVQDWGKEFIYIVSQADKAFNYLLGDTEDMNR